MRNNAPLKTKGAKVPSDSYILKKRTSQ